MPTVFRKRSSDNLPDNEPRRKIPFWQIIYFSEPDDAGGKHSIPYPVPATGKERTQAVLFRWV